MATDIWTGGGTNNANNPGSNDWGNHNSTWNNSEPTSTSDVVLGGVAGSAVYTVTMVAPSNAAFDSVNSLTINDAGLGATLNVNNQTLTIGSTSATAVNLSGANVHITIDGGTINDAGGINLAAGSSLLGFGTVSVGAAIAGSGTLGTSNAAGTLTLTGAGSVSSGVVLSINSAAATALDFNLAATSAAAITINSANQTLEVGANGALTISAAESITNGKILMAGGSLTDTSGLTAGTGSTLIGSGNVNGPVAGAGIIEANGGTLILGGGAITATTLEVANASTAILDLNDNSISGGTITFLGANGTLLLGASDFSSQTLTGFSDKIAGLNVGTNTTPTNEVNLRGVTEASVTSATLSGTTIIVHEGATAVATLTLSSAPAGTPFVDWTTDGSGGTDIFLSSMVCYCGGTLIRTETGEVPVEELAIGDRVATLSGAAKPIKWIGRRSYQPRFLGGNPGVLPVRIEAGAIADGVPARDLWVSPEHALYIDGLLLPARLLVNGATIHQVERVDRLEYFHIELAAHDIIFAEGATAETFIDCGGRGIFHNSEEFAALYPDDEPADGQAYLALLEQHAAKAPAVRAALLERAVTLGRVELRSRPPPRRRWRGRTRAVGCRADPPLCHRGRCKQRHDRIAQRRARADGGRRAGRPPPRRAGPAGGAFGRRPAHRDRPGVPGAARRVPSR